MRLSSKEWLLNQINNIVPEGYASGMSVFGIIKEILWRNRKDITVAELIDLQKYIMDMVENAEGHEAHALRVYREHCGYVKSYLEGEMYADCDFTKKTKEYNDIQLKNIERALSIHKESVGNIDVPKFWQAYMEDKRVAVKE